MKTVTDFQNAIPELEALVGHTFTKRDVLTEAFIHPSMVNVLGISYERLEFLGDGILELFVRQWLFEKNPEAAEGELTKWKTNLVNHEACNYYAKCLKIEPYLIIKDEDAKNIRGESPYGDLFEAFIAALYLDGGFEAIHALILTHLLVAFEERLKIESKDSKTALQEYFQKSHHELPTYEVISEQGPEHEKKFVVAVVFQGEVLAKGHGPSIKKAEKMAAKKALEGNLL